MIRIHSFRHWFWLLILSECDAVCTPATSDCSLWSTANLTDSRKMLYGPVWSIAKAGPPAAGSCSGLSTFPPPPPRVLIAVKLALLQQRMCCHENAQFAESLDLFFRDTKWALMASADWVDWAGPLILVTRVSPSRRTGTTTS